MKINDVKKEYEYEDILEMLGGYKYFTVEQCKYVYHKLRGDVDETNYYLNVCMHEVKQVNELHRKLKSPEEIEALNKVKEVEEINL